MTTRITTEHGVDVTEGVQAAYDLVLSSMDWGSGFLSIEDIEPLLRLALASGYDTEPIAAYIADSTSRPEDWWYIGAEDRKQRRQEWLESARAKIEALRQEMALTTPQANTSSA
jgi:hypothetical protein